MTSPGEPAWRPPLPIDPTDLAVLQVLEDGHTHDRIILADASLYPALARVIKALPTVAHIIVVGDAPDLPDNLTFRKRPLCVLSYGDKSLNPWPVSSTSSHPALSKST